MQEALRAAPPGTTGHAPMDRQGRVLFEMTEAFSAGKDAEVVKMAEEGQAVARELRRTRPGAAAIIYHMLGASFVQRCEYVKGVGLLEQARALAVEAGNRTVLGGVCNSLGHFHHSQGEHKKAIKEGEQARTIAVELGDRPREGDTCGNLGLCYNALKQYDKAIELFEQSLAIYEELGEKSRLQVRVCRNDLFTGELISVS